MTSRERFLAACACQPLERPPVWIMRQAGRYLPEYRALKRSIRFSKWYARRRWPPRRRSSPCAASHSMPPSCFPTSLSSPRRSAGLPVQGRRRHRDGVAPGDPRADRRAPARCGRAGTARLRGRRAGAAQTRTGWAARAARFGGSPWTLATYMLEGGSAEEFARSKTLFYSDRTMFDALLEKLTAALIEYFRLQIRRAPMRSRFSIRGAELWPDRTTRPRRCAGFARSSQRCRANSR